MSDKDNQVQKEEVVKGDLLPGLQSVFENIAKEEGYITYEIVITKINSGGANYSGELFEVDVIGKTEHGDKETNLFLKKCVKDHVLSKRISVSNLYATENFVYKDLAKHYHELQTQANVPEEQRYKMVKWYKNSVSTAIILENLAKTGYRTPHRMDVVSLKYAELCIKELAKFHALSFVLKIKDPDYFDNKLQEQLDIPLKRVEKSMSGMDVMIKLTSKDLDPINKARVEKVRAKFFEKLIMYLSPESNPVTCLCHGDYRTSNILMKENEGEVAEVIPVDYQLVNVGSPIIDFLYFIVWGTDRKFRVQHLDHLKGLYFDTMSNFLKYFDIDSNDVFPRKEMEELFHQRMDYIPIIALLSL